MDPVKTRIPTFRMRSIIVAILVLAYCIGTASAQGTKREDHCYSCHSAIGDKASTAYEKDIHFARGFSCAECHGGDSSSEDQEAAMNLRKGFIGIPKKNVSSERCGRCHNNADMMKKYNYSGKTGQLDMLQKSIHGRSSSKENEIIVQCITCHGGHGIKAVSNPDALVSPRHINAVCTKCHSDANYMKQYNPSLPVDQLEKYRTSVHGIKNAQGDLKPAVCSSCHGNHDIHKAEDRSSYVNVFNIPATCGKCHANAEYMKGYNIPTTQLKEYTGSVHGIALLQKHDASAPSCNHCHGNHGAVPPGVQSISNVCGTCHVMNAQLFSKSIHKKVFDERNLPECETCHGKHGINKPTEAMLAVGPNTLCGRCHTATEGPNGYKAALRMRALIDSLQSTEKTAQVLIDKAEQKGMEVSEAKFKLRDVKQARLKSRTAIHSFDLKDFETTIGEGLTITTAAQAEGENALHEYSFRRWGLGIATLIITILCIGLFIFIKRIEKKQTA